MAMRSRFWLAAAAFCSPPTNRSKSLTLLDQRIITNQQQLAFILRRNDSRSYRRYTKHSRRFSTAPAEPNSNSQSRQNRVQDDIDNSDDNVVGQSVNNVKVKEGKNLSRKQRKDLVRAASRAANDPYDNPIARKILQWSAIEPILNKAERETLHWVKRVVVGLNLCPFAERTLLHEKLKVRVLLDQDSDTVLEQVLDEMQKLKAKNEGTTLVVCPNLYKENFKGFLQIVDVVEQNIAANNWDGILQVAPFHPLFKFEGSEQDAPDNYTNRSPHPMFHLLREDDVTMAVEQLENHDAGTVWRRNVKLLTELRETLTPEDFTAVVEAQDRPSSLKLRLRDVLQRYRVSLHKQIATKEEVPVVSEQKDVDSEFSQNEEKSQTIS